MARCTTNFGPKIKRQKINTGTRIINQKKGLLQWKIFVNLFHQNVDGNFYFGSKCVSVWSLIENLKIKLWIWISPACRLPPHPTPSLSCGKSKEQFRILALAWSSTYTIKLLCNKKYDLQFANFKYEGILEEKWQKFQSLVLKLCVLSLRPAN